MTKNRIDLPVETTDLSTTDSMTGLAPFFLSEGDAYRPTPACRGPWDPKSLHGAIIVGLLAFEIERLYGSDEYLPARLTVDMYRLPGFSPVTIKTRLVRDGYRIKVIEAEWFSDDVSMAMATCQLLRKTANADMKVWSAPDWDVPPPETVDQAPNSLMMAGSRLLRYMTDGSTGPRPARIWMNERRPLVDDVPLSPWLRIAAVADFVNPAANSGAGGLAYINSDLTLYLHRLPVDGWVGMEVTNHRATDGVAVGECYIYDREGFIGTNTVCGLAQKR